MAVTQKTFVFHPAELAVKDIKPVFIEDMEKIGFSEYVIDMFDLDIRKNKYIQIRAVIYNAMNGTDYMKGKHRNMSRFTEDLQAYFEKMGVNTITTINQIQRVMLGESYEFTAICQIAYFLKICIDDLFDSNVEPGKVAEEQKSHYIKNRSISDWKKFDKENVKRFDRFCKGIYDGSANKNGRPERVSERMVYDFLGITAYGFKNMPECAAVYEKYAESYGESYARKIAWAYTKLRNEKDNIYMIDIKRLSGVKKKNFPAAEPYLEKYADKDSAEKIISLIR